jgi:hypothetical protein
MSGLLKTERGRGLDFFPQRGGLFKMERGEGGLDFFFQHGELLDVDKGAGGLLELFFQTGG